MIWLIAPAALASGVLYDADGYATLDALEVSVEVVGRVATASSTFRFGAADGAQTFAAVLPEGAAVVGLRYAVGGVWVEAVASAPVAAPAGPDGAIEALLPAPIFTVALPDPAGPVDLELTWQRVLTTSGGELSVTVPLDDGGLNPSEPPVTVSVVVDGSTIDAWSGGLGVDRTVAWTEPPLPFGIGLWTYRPPVDPYTGEAPGPGYALVVLRPGPVGDDVRVDRLFTFVLDTSSSMAGAPLRTAVAAGATWLDDLQPADRFDLVAYDSQTRLFRARAQAADPAAVDRAVAFLDAQQAAGLSDPEEALTTALRAMEDTVQGRAFFGCGGTIRQGDGPPVPGAPVERVAGEAVRVAPTVVWLTDGGATAGTVALDAIAAAVAGANTVGASVYAIGVGPEVDRELLERVTSENRGVARFVDGVGGVDGVVDELRARIADPVLVQPTIRLDAATDAAPAALSDVTGGHEVAWAFRYAEPGTYTLRLSGVRGDEETVERWTVTLPEVDAEAPSVATAWAQLRVADLEVAARAGDDAALAEIAVLVETWGVSSELAPLGFDGVAATSSDAASGCGCAIAARHGGLPALLALWLAGCRRSRRSVVRALDVAPVAGGGARGWPGASR